MPGPLAAKIRAKYPGAYDDLDDATLEKQILAKYPQYRDLVEPEPEPAGDLAKVITGQPVGNQQRLESKTGHPLARLGYGLANIVRNDPSLVGAMVGGTAAAPLTGGMSLLPALAAIGGASALGSAAGQAVAGQDVSVGEMAKQGIGGAAGHGLGMGVAKVAGRVAPKLMKGILRPSRRVQDEFGDVVTTALKERIPVGQSAQAAARMKGSAATARGMVAAAEKAGGAPIKAKELHGPLRKVGETLKKRTELGLPDETGELVQRAKAIRAANPQGIPLTRAQDLKTEAQTLADRTFRAIDKGNAVKDTTALADKAVAQGLRGAIEQRVPDVRAVNEQTQQLMGLVEALEDAEARSGGIVGLNPMNWIGALAPGAGSKVAFGIDALSRAPLPGLGRLNLQALLAAINSSEPQRPQ